MITATVDTTNPFYTTNNLYYTTSTSWTVTANVGSMIHPAEFTWYYPDTGGCHSELCDDDRGDFNRLFGEIGSDGIE